MDGQRILALALATDPDILAELEEMHLADAPDYMTAILAGLAHGLTPQKALHAAWGKWMSDNAESIQEFGLANFYDGLDASCAMVNYTGVTQYLAIMVAEMGRRNVELGDRVAVQETKMAKLKEAN